MATSAERIRVLRERQRSGFRRLTIDVSDDDLRAIAKLPHLPNSDLELRKTTCSRGKLVFPEIRTDWVSKPYSGPWT
jgi:hypothetical protein